MIASPSHMQDFIAMAKRLSQGLLISFEGGEGSGKTTQINLLAKRLLDLGIAVETTREPGGTQIGQAIREILLNSKNKTLLPMTELLLYSADRYQHVQEKILPALAQKKWLLTDRFVDSSRVYQGEARAVPDATLTFLCNLACQDLKPDLTFLCDLPPELGLERSRKRLAQQAFIQGSEQNLDEGRFEEENLAFHQKVRQGFLKLSQENPERFRVIDANQSVSEISQNIWKELSLFLKNKG